MSIYHAIDVKIAITRYETIIAKHEATQKMYSLKHKSYLTTINLSTRSK